MTDLLPYALMIAILAPPTIAVLRKAGRSPWWALVLLAPPLALVALWVLAFTRWPALKK